MQPLSPLTIERICSMYQQNFSLKTIAKETKLSLFKIRNIIDARNIIKGESRLKKKEVKGSKYDYLIDEPKAPGKFYADYVKKGKKS